MSQGFNNVAGSKKSVSYLFQKFFKKQRLYIALYIQGKSTIKPRLFILEIKNEQDNLKQKFNEGKDNV